MPSGIYRRTGPSELSARLKVISQLLHLRYSRKVEIAQDIIGRSLAALPESLPGVAVMFSGGCDSTVLLHLVSKIHPGALAIYNNTGLGRPGHDEQLRKVVAKFRVKFIETAAGDPFKMWRELGHLPILSKRGFTRYKRELGLRISPVQCCYQLKEIPALAVYRDQKVGLVFWGNRADESNRRKLSFADNGFMFKPKKRPWIQSYPLQHWQDADIQRYLQENVPGYVPGGIETGCRCCATDITIQDNNLARLLREDRPFFDKVMVEGGFGAEILKLNGCSRDLGAVLAKYPEFLCHVNRGLRA